MGLLADSCDTARTGRHRLSINPVATFSVMKVRPQRINSGLLFREVVYIVTIVFQLASVNRGLGKNENVPR